MTSSTCPNVTCSYRNSFGYCSVSACINRPDVQTNVHSINVDDTLREMIAYFEGCYKNAGKDTKAQERFGRYLLVLNLML